MIPKFDWGSLNFSILKDLQFWFPAISFFVSSLSLEHDNPPLLVTFLSLSRALSLLWKFAPLCSSRAANCSLDDTQFWGWAYFLILKPLSLSWKAWDEFSWIGVRYFTLASLRLFLSRMSTISSHMFSSSGYPSTEGYVYGFCLRSYVFGARGLPVLVMISGWMLSLIIPL